MKANDLSRRLQKDRPMVAISKRMPEDVIGDLKRVAPHLGFSGYKPLIRAYVGQGLRDDLAKLESSSSLEDFVENLRQRGVDERVITEALADLLDHDIQRIPNVASTRTTIVLTTAKETREIPISDPKSTDGRPRGSSLGRAGAV